MIPNGSCSAFTLNTSFFAVITLKTAFCHDILVTITKTQYQSQHMLVYTCQSGLSVTWRSLVCVCIRGVHLCTCLTIRSDSDYLLNDSSHSIFFVNYHLLQAVGCILFWTLFLFRYPWKTKHKSFHYSELQFVKCAAYNYLNDIKK